jgi:hypothetical protein
MIKYYNRIDYFRRLGDLFAVIFFFGSFIYLYKSNIQFKYKNFIMLVFFVAGVCDLIFTIDAFKVNGNLLTTYNNVQN